MAQIFSADAQTTKSTVNVPPAAVAVVTQTNPLQPPFQTCKAKVLATFVVEVDPTETQLEAVIIRNPQSEALIISDQTIFFGAAADQQVNFTLAGIDEVPDPRQVTYQLSLASSTNTGNDVVQIGAYIEATLISG